MRTIEQQEKNISNARGYAVYKVTQAIQASQYSEEDKETMIRIINARYDKEALECYYEADTMVRDALQDIIEETYYNKNFDKGQKCPKCGRIYTEPPALSRTDNKTFICPDCGLKEALDIFKQYDTKNDI